MKAAVIKNNPVPGTPGLNSLAKCVADGFTVLTFRACRRTRAMSNGRVARVRSKEILRWLTRR